MTNTDHIMTDEEFWTEFLGEPCPITKKRKAENRRAFFVLLIGCVFSLV